MMNHGKTVEESSERHRRRATCIPYSRKIWQGIKFGDLADQPAYRQIKIRQYKVIHAYWILVGVVSGW